MPQLFPLQFEQVSSKKVSDFILEQLEEAIILKELMSEEQLPTERELAEIFNASRLAVREALAHLEQKGLVEKRLGAKGGTFVLPVTMHAHRRTREEIKSDWHDMVELSEFRLIIEPEAAYYAAKRIAPEQLRELEGYLDKSMADDCSRELFRALDVKFHLLIAKASGNSHIERSVRRIRTRINRALDLMPYNPDVRVVNVDHHRKLFEALAGRQAQQSYDIMKAHIGQSLEAIHARVFTESDSEGGTPV
ncbi:FadR family transcriptional regulator [Paenibacillus sp. IB182496]|uniref:Pyruvate dehydrogenase complex repressor n=1 Tax=Paenibacillus sabuli TaxID=2772509 RepID=A0A927BRF5_9BACL|nr:FadR/GntR family transcriptional regulator [Paenibacillus sabuli]MBD2845382.1 FadR family transcriptional regulator [Paenibacillus sabuli]